MVAVINLNNVARTLTLDLPDVGFQKAGSVKDIWNDVTATNAVTAYSVAAEAHGTLLLRVGPDHSSWCICHLRCRDLKGQLSHFQSETQLTSADIREPLARYMAKPPAPNIP